jgi:hypothetical protein
MTDLTICPYCHGRAVFRKFGQPLYPYSREFGPVWVCPTDFAYVGSHPNGLPLGRLADKPLRDAKIEAHRAFDPLWKDWDVAYPDLKTGSAKVRRTMKGRAYAWLAEKMGLSIEDTHIGHFGIDQCYQVVDIIDRLRPTAATVRAWAEARKNVA